MPDYQARNTSMSHLSSERLAALADEAPTAAELAHLAGCAECARWLDLAGAVNRMMGR